MSGDVERVTEAVREVLAVCTCTPYPAGEGPEIDCPMHGRADYQGRAVAQVLLAPGGVVAGMVAERVEALAPDVCKRLCDMDGNPRLFVSGEVRAVLRAALAAEPAANSPESPTAGISGSGAGGSTFGDESGTEGDSETRGDE
jgi:hypothetical protein